MIEPGQRFKQGSVVWVVSRVTPIDQMLHVELVKVGDSTERKLISMSTLIEGSDFVQE